MMEERCMRGESRFQWQKKRESNRLQQGGQDLLQTLTNTVTERDQDLMIENNSVTDAKDNLDQGPDLGREEDTGLDREILKTEDITPPKDMVQGAKKDEPF